MLDLSGFVKNDELVIDKENWSHIKENYEKDVVKQAISDIIKDLPLPMRKITYQDAINDFNKLVELDSQSLICEGEWFSRYFYKYPLSNKYIKTCKIGNQSSDYFHQESRWLCDSINAPSPYRTWHTEKFRLTLLNGLWTQKTKEINNQTLRSCIALRKYIASQFRPSAAKAIYEYFNAEKILDFSSGWGDRFSGFLSLKKNLKMYIGTDPNRLLHSGYHKQTIMCSNSLNKNKQYITSIGAEPFEDMDLSYDNYFDLVFTSPPYFLAERYSQEPTQSWQRYKKLEDWLNKFLFTSLEKAWKSLRVGGYMAINISDVYLHHKVNKICDPMCDYIKDVLGGQFIEILGYQLSKRPNSKSDKKGVHCEPIFIWQKVK